MLLAYSPSYANASSLNLGDETIRLDPFYDPSYDPIGLKILGFTLNPSITMGAKYTDNVYAVENNIVSDVIFITRADLALKSDFTRHRLNIRPFVEMGRYSNYSSEDYDDHGITIDAMIDVTENNNIPLLLNYAQLHEDRENPENQGNISPLVYNVSEASTGLAHTKQTIVYKIISSFKRVVYDDSEGVSGTIDESSRDRDIFGIHANIGFTPEAIISPYAYGNFQKLEYPNSDSGGLRRNSRDIEAGLGTIINLSELSRISLNVGQRNRNFDETTFNDLKTVTYGTNISWIPIEYLSFLFEGDKSIEEAAFSGTSASVNTRYRISANYQFRYNLYFQPTFSLLDRDYQGTNEGHIETQTAGLNIIYKMNPNIWMTASYQHTDQEKKKESPSLRAFQRDIYNVSLKLQF